MLNQAGCNCPEALIEIFGYMINRMPGRVQRVVMTNWTHGGNLQAKEARINEVLARVYDISPIAIFTVRDANNNPSSIAVNAAGELGMLAGFGAG